MKQYKLSVVMHSPSQDTEYKYFAEVPALPGCRAWGDTPAQALEYVQSVAAEFILSYMAHRRPLPKEVEAAAYEPVGTRMRTEVTVHI